MAPFPPSSPSPIPTPAPADRPRGSRVVVVLAVVGGALFWLCVVGGYWGVASGASAQNQVQPAGEGPVALEDINRLYRDGSNGSDELLDRVFGFWDPGYTAPLLELDHIVGSDRAFRARLMDRLADAWGLEKAGAVRDQRDALFQALWAEPVTPLPGYAEWKANLYAQIDPRFRTYFDDFTDEATIRLDEVRWGGVRRDGIPPLVRPRGGAGRRRRGGLLWMTMTWSSAWTSTARPARIPSASSPGTRW